MKNGNKYVIKRKAGQDKKILVKVLKKNDKYSIIGEFTAEELEKLNVDAKDYTKISQYDTVLVYPDNYN